MLAERLGRCDTGTGDRPYTLQVPQRSRQIFSCKLIAVGFMCCLILQLALSACHCRMPCIRTKAKRSVKMPIATPISTRKVPATSSGDLAQFLQTCPGPWPSNPPSCRVIDGSERRGSRRPVAASPLASTMSTRGQAAASLTTQPWSAVEWIADTQLARPSVLLDYGIP
jgi:hypothetical protein